MQRLHRGRICCRDKVCNRCCASPPQRRSTVLWDTRCKKLTGNPRTKSLMDNANKQRPPPRGCTCQAHSGCTKNCWPDRERVDMCQPHTEHTRPRTLPRSLNSMCQQDTGYMHSALMIPLRHCTCRVCTSSNSVMREHLDLDSKFLAGISHKLTDW